MKKNLLSIKKSAGRPKSAEKTKAILDAAGDHFLRLGFELTSMDAVAKAANVSKLTIYSNFEDKDALFKAVITRKCQNHNMEHDFMSFAALPVEVVLTQIGLNFVKLVLSNEAIAMHRIVEAESLRHPKIAVLFYEAGPKTVKEAMASLFSLWHTQKKLQCEDVQKAVEHFFCLIKGEVHMKMLLNLQKAPSEAMLRQHVASCVRLFMAGYAVAS